MCAEAYRRVNTDWLAGSCGVSVHWTSQSQPRTGQAVSYQEAVERFDLDRFMRQLKETGARHLIFTTNHAGEYAAGPNPVLDYLLPGRTCRRDLLGELAHRLAEAGIRLIFYRNPACNAGDDVTWKEAVGYGKPPFDLFAGRLLAMVECLSRRYGSYLSGWWFDCGYSLDPRFPGHRVPQQMVGWQFPWAALAAAAKTGNPECAVAFNSGANERMLYTEHQDYTAGEVTTLAYQPQGRFPDGLQLHLWTCLDNNRWIHTEPESPFAAPLYADAELLAFTRRITGAGGAVTYNLDIDQTGLISAAAVNQLRQITRSL